MEATTNTAAITAALRNVCQDEHGIDFDAEMTDNEKADLADLVAGILADDPSVGTTLAAVFAVSEFLEG